MWNISISPAGLGQLGKERREKAEEAHPVLDSRTDGSRNLLETLSKTEARGKIQKEELKSMKWGGKFHRGW